MEKFVIIDDNGKIIIPPIYQVILPTILPKYFAITQNLEEGIIGKDSVIYVPPAYERVEIKITNDTFFLAYKENKTFIYDDNHLPPLAVYPSALGEQPLIADIHNLATREAYCRATLLPSRWALTPPFHPYPESKLAAVILCYATIPSRTSSR